MMRRILIYDLRLGVHSLLFILLTFQARAHDPGLSTATVTVENEQIAVLLGFAQKDVESMMASGPNVAEIGAAKGFAAVQSELESVAANEFSLYWGRQRAIPEQIAARRKDTQNIEISLLFQRRSVWRGPRGLDPFRTFAVGPSSVPSGPNGEWSQPRASTALSQRKLSGHQIARSSRRHPRFQRE